MYWTTTDNHIIACYNIFRFMKTEGLPFAVAQAYRWNRNCFDWSSILTWIFIWMFIWQTTSQTSSTISIFNFNPLNHFRKICLNNLMSQDRFNFSILCSFIYFRGNLFVHAFSCSYISIFSGNIWEVSRLVWAIFCYDRTCHI